MSFAKHCPIEVIEGAVKGDADAFACIYETYKQPVYSLAYRMLQNPDSASDILQQVFEKIMIRLSDIQDHNKLGSWIKRITYNCVIDHIRANDKEAVGLGEDYILSHPHLSYKDPLGSFDLDVFLESLDARERMVLVLFSIENYTHQEIAQELEISVSNSKQIYSRALKKLVQLAKLERYSGNKVKTNE